MTTHELETERREEAAAADERRGPDARTEEAGALSNEPSWDTLAELALGERAARATPRARAARALRRPATWAVVAGLALAALAWRTVGPGSGAGAFPGRDAASPAPQGGETVVLKLDTSPSDAPEVTVREGKPALDIVLIGAPDIDPGIGWKVTVSHPGREIWKSKWSRRFERVKDEWRLGFELDGRDLPEGPLSITIEEEKPGRPDESGKRASYRMRVKRR
jgi:hypothetical protein